MESHHLTVLVLHSIVGQGL